MLLYTFDKTIHTWKIVRRVLVDIHFNAKVETLSNASILDTLISCEPTYLSSYTFKDYKRR